MADSYNAINAPNHSPETVQQQLASIVFINPATGQPHSWNKSLYIKKLALKAKNALQAISMEWNDFSLTLYHLYYLLLNQQGTHIILRQLKLIYFHPSF